MAIFNRNKNEVIGSPQNRSGLRDFLSFLSIIALALFFAFIIISFVFRSYQVDGPSMEPTLQNNDKLIIWKVPKTWADITGHQWVPKRGSIIVFDQPNLSVCGQDTSRQLIKRVIGLPGDRVVISNGVVTIFDSKYPSGFQPDASLAYNKTHFIPTTTPDMSLKLGAHQLFVMGDNRPVSCDSRSFGPINTSQIIGQLLLRILPLSQAKTY